MSRRLSSCVKDLYFLYRSPTFIATSRHLGTEIKKNIQTASKGKFEVRVTFPNSHGPARTKVQNLQAGNEPMVYLLGWAGCKERDLQKYSDIYEQLGFPTIQSRASLTTLFSVTSVKDLDDHARHLIGLREKHDYVEKPLLFHIFSNGGSVVYHSLSNVIQERKEEGKVVGCIFDSGPAIITFRSSRNFIFTIVPGSVAWRYLYANCKAFWYRCLHNWRLFSDFARRRPYVERRVWYQLVKEPNICPQLFFYSKKDILTDHRDVQKFASERKKLGVKTDEMMWEDSGHVSHMPKHKEAYISKLYAFLNTCLSRQ